MRRGRAPAVDQHAAWEEDNRYLAMALLKAILRKAMTGERLTAAA